MKPYIYLLLLAGLFNITTTRAMDDFPPREAQTLFMAIERKEGEGFFRPGNSPSNMRPPLPAGKKTIFYRKKETSWGKKKIACPYCTKEYSNNSHCNRHIETAHNESKFLCDRQNCEKSFPRLDTLQEHKRQVHNKKKDRFLCAVYGCPGKGNFGCKASLVKHLKRQHGLMMIIGTEEYDRLTQYTSPMPDESSESP